MNDRQQEWHEYERGARRLQLGLVVALPLALAALALGIFWLV